jgi:methyl-accepting chemotaxis protein
MTSGTQAWRRNGDVDMPTFLKRPGLAGPVVRVAALAVLGAEAVDAIFDAAPHGWAHGVSVTAALALAVAVLTLFVRAAAQPRKAADGQPAAMAAAVAQTPPAGEKPQAGEPEAHIAAIQAKAQKVADQLEGHSFFTRLLRKQIDVITSMTEDAAGTILGRLGDVDRAMNGLMSVIDQSGANDRVAMIVDRAERQVDENRQMVRQFQEQRARDLKESEREQNEITSAADELGRLAQGVRDIARQTNMLAFNATIEAGRAGDAGRGFAVVALEVKTLSRQSDKAAQDIRAGIAKLRETIGTSLESIVHERVREEDHTFGLINTAIAELTENMEGLIAHQRDVLIKVKDESSHINSLVMEVMASIQFQDVTRQQLESLAMSSEMVDNHITDMRRMLSDLTAEFDAGHFLDMLRETYDRYVMIQQRNAFNEVTGKAVQEDVGLKIELF